MIPGAPIPEWKQLRALFGVGRAVDLDAVAGPWRRAADEQAIWHSRSCWALEVVYRARRAMAGAEESTVWLPAHFCNTSTAPLRMAGARIVFYPVTELARPAWQGIESMAGEVGALGVFVLVHAFGWPNECEEALRLCRRTGAWLVEDAAHCLAPGRGIGVSGDCVLYSPHKVLPTPDGAVMLVRSAGLRSALRDASSRLAPRAPALRGWRTRRVLQRLAGRWLWAGARHGRRFEEDPAYDELDVTPRMSRLAGRVLSTCGELRSVAETRVANARQIEAALAGRESGRPMFPIEDGLAPYRLPLVYPSQECAAAAHARFARAGVPVDTWPDLPAEVRAEPQRHEAAIRLRNTTVCFPVHQSLPMRTLLDVVRRA